MRMHHLIVAHEVTNIGNDGSQLSMMAKQAQEATGVCELTAIADRGYFKGEEILACEAAGVDNESRQSRWTSGLRRTAGSASRISSTTRAKTSIVFLPARS